MKKHAHLLAILAVLLLCIGSIILMKGAPRDGGCKGAESHKNSLLETKDAYEVIETYLRQTFDDGILPTGYEMHIDFLYWPYSTTDEVRQYFYQNDLPQEVLTALDDLYYSETITGNGVKRRHYIDRMIVFPEFTMVVFHPSHRHDYILFTAEGEPDKAAFLAAYPQCSDVTFTPVEGRWYISEPIYDSP